MLSAAPSAEVTSSSRRVMFCTGTVRAVAYVPRVSPIATRSPTAKPVTPSPIAVIVPAPSKPTRRGSVIGGSGRIPARCLTSTGFTPAASIRTTTSPGPATGSGTSTRRRTSGAPISVWTIARAMHSGYRSAAGERLHDPLRRYRLRGAQTLREHADAVLLQHPPHLDERGGGIRCRRDRAAGLLVRLGHALVLGHACAVLAWLVRERPQTLQHPLQVAGQVREPVHAGLRDEARPDQPAQLQADVVQRPQQCERVL